MPITIYALIEECEKRTHILSYAQKAIDSIFIVAYKIGTSASLTVDGHLHIAERTRNLTNTFSAIEQRMQFTANIKKATLSSKKFVCDIPCALSQNLLLRSTFEGLVAASGTLMILRVGLLPAEFLIPEFPGGSLMPGQEFIAQSATLSALAVLLTKTTGEFLWWRFLNQTFKPEKDARQWLCMDSPILTPLEFAVMPDHAFFPHKEMRVYAHTLTELKRYYNEFIMGQRPNGLKDVIDVIQYKAHFDADMPTGSTNIIVVVDLEATIARMKFLAKELSSQVSARREQFLQDVLRCKASIENRIRKIDSKTEISRKKIASISTNEPSEPYLESLQQELRHLHAMRAACKERLDDIKELITKLQDPTNKDLCTPEERYYQEYLGMPQHAIDALMDGTGVLRISLNTKEIVKNLFNKKIVSSDALNRMMQESSRHQDIELALSKGASNSDTIPQHPLLGDARTPEQNVSNAETPRTSAKNKARAPKSSRESLKMPLATSSSQEAKQDQTPLDKTKNKEDMNKRIKSYVKKTNKLETEIRAKERDRTEFVLREPVKSTAFSFYRHQLLSFNTMLITNFLDREWCIAQTALINTPDNLACIPNSELATLDHEKCTLLTQRQKGLRAIPLTNKTVPEIADAEKSTLGSAKFKVVHCRLSRPYTAEGIPNLKPLNFGYQVPIKEYIGTQLLLQIPTSNPGTFASRTILRDQIIQVTPELKKRLSELSQHNDIAKMNCMEVSKRLLESLTNIPLAALHTNAARHQFTDHRKAIGLLLLRTKQEDHSVHTVDALLNQFFDMVAEYVHNRLLAECKIHALDHVSIKKEGRFAHMKNNLMKEQLAFANRYSGFVMAPLEADIQDRDTFLQEIENALIEINCVDAAFTETLKICQQEAFGLLQRRAQQDSHTHTIIHKIATAGESFTRLLDARARIRPFLRRHLGRPQILARAIDSILSLAFAPLDTAILTTKLLASASFFLIFSKTTLRRNKGGYKLMGTMTQFVRERFIRMQQAMTLTVCIENARTAHRELLRTHHQYECQQDSANILKSSSEIIALLEEDQAQLYVEAMQTGTQYCTQGSVTGKNSLFKILQFLSKDLLQNLLDPRDAIKNGFLPIHNTTKRQINIITQTLKRTENRQSITEDLLVKIKVFAEISKLNRTNAITADYILNTLEDRCDRLAAENRMTVRDRKIRIDDAKSHFFFSALHAARRRWQKEQESLSQDAKRNIERTLKDSAKAIRSKLDTLGQTPGLFEPLYELTELLLEFNPDAVEKGYRCHSKKLSTLMSPSLKEESGNVDLESLKTLFQSRVMALKTLSRLKHQTPSQMNDLLALEDYINSGGIKLLLNRLKLTIMQRAQSFILPAWVENNGCIKTLAMESLSPELASTAPSQGMQDGPTPAEIATLIETSKTQLHQDALNLQTLRQNKTNQLDIAIYPTKEPTRLLSESGRSRTHNTNIMVLESDSRSSSIDCSDGMLSTILWGDSKKCNKVTDYIAYNDELPGTSLEEADGIVEISQEYKFEPSKNGESSQKKALCKCSSIVVPGKLLVLEIQTNNFATPHSAFTEEREPETTQYLVEQFTQKINEINSEFGSSILVEDLIRCRATAISDPFPENIHFLITIEAPQATLTGEGSPRQLKVSKMALSLLQSIGTKTENVLRTESNPLNLSPPTHSRPPSTSFTETFLPSENTEGAKHTQSKSAGILDGLKYIMGCGIKPGSIYSESTQSLTTVSTGDKPNPILSNMSFGKRIIETQQTSIG